MHDAKYSASGMKHPRDTSGGDEDEEKIKARREGSLGRIIASTVVASFPLVVRTAATETTSSKPESISTNEWRTDILLQVIKAFNFGDMNGLATLVRLHVCETCFLVCPDVSHPINGRAEIMMYFSLTFENFPDGIYRVNPNSTSVFEDTISTTYSFTGTRVFNHPMHELFSQIKEHWSEVKQSVQMGEDVLIDNIAYCWIPESTMAHPDTLRSTLAHPDTLQSTSMDTSLVTKAPSPNPAFAKHSSASVPSSSPSSVSSHSRSRARSSSRGGPVPGPEQPGRGMGAGEGVGMGVNVGKVDSQSDKARGGGDESAGGGVWHRLSSSLGSMASRFINSFPMRDRATKMKRRMDFAFNDRDQIVRIMIVPT